MASCNWVGFFHKGVGGDATRDKVEDRTVFRGNALEKAHSDIHRDDQITLFGQELHNLMRDMFNDLDAVVYVYEAWHTRITFERCDGVRNS